jgi:hypothetical protein
MKIADTGRRPIGARFLRRVIRLLRECHIGLKNVTGGNGTRFSMTARVLSPISADPNALTKTR